VKHFFLLLLSVIYAYPYRDTDTLQNHLATVVDFLHRCSKVDRDGKTEFLHTFHCYMVTSCWKKMHHRMTHRYSQAMLNSLISLTPQDMQLFFKHFSSKLKLSLQKDSTLTGTLVDLKEQGLLQHFLDGPLAEYLDLDSTDATILVDELQHVSASQDQQGLRAYNKHTCFVFHLLLIAIIGGFRHHLQSLYGSHRREHNAHQVLQFGRLLWRIAYPQMLTNHLQLLEAASFLHTPPAAIYYM
jgi:hypothetical protein